MKLSRFFFNLIIILKNDTVFYFTFNYVVKIFIFILLPVYIAVRQDKD